MAKPSLLWLLATLCAASIGAQPLQRTLDSLRREIAVSPAGRFVPLAFALADTYMEVDRYDSAQHWLNRIAERLPLKEPSLPNYYLSSRQAEVYYYNGLQRLGLQESQRSLSMAQALNDSLLLADSHNFIGLFLINLDSPQNALPHFHEGIRYVRQPPHAPQYLSLSKPHHLWGNLGEAYEKLQRFDSAQWASRASLRLATEINWQRGVAVAHTNLGSVYAKTGHPDSALHHYTHAVAAAQTGGDFDVELLAYGGLATAEDNRQHPAEAVAWLQKGFDLIDRHALVNDLFLGQFLDAAVAVYRHANLKEPLAKALQQKAQLLAGQMANNNLQINAILNAGLANERRLLQLQVREAEQQREIANTRLYLLAALLVALAAGFVFYRYKTRQKLRLVRLQAKISQDLHDDVGSSVSSLQVYSAVADKLLETEPAKAQEMLRRIGRETTAVLENISDIVWSMKPSEEQPIETRIKNFAASVLGAAEIEFSVTVDEGVDASVRTIEARRNLLLLVKEAVNNAVKHSRATQVTVTVRRQATQVEVTVCDNGVGFVTGGVRNGGNGLAHMRRRTAESGGEFRLDAGPGKGTRITALFPLTKIGDGR